MPSHIHPRSDLHPDASIFVSFPDPSISIPHYPGLLIHSIQPKASLSFPPEPFIFLPTLCCHLTPIWIIWPDPKPLSISSPCTIPPISGPLALTFGTCCSSSSTRLNMTAVSSCLPRSHKVTDPSATASCGRPCLPLEPLAWLPPKSTVPGDLKFYTTRTCFPRQKCWGQRERCLLCSRHMVPLPTSNAPHSNLKPQVKHSLNLGTKTTLSLDSAPSTLTSSLPSSNLLQFAKFKKLSLFILLPFACKVWLSMIFYCSHFIFTLLDLQDRTFHYLFAISSFFAILSGLSVYC